MPLKDKKQYNSYMNQYMKDRWERRRQEAIAYLGGQCIKCGENHELEFHHKDHHYE